MAESTPPEPARPRWALLLVLCAWTLACWSLEYKPFLLPNNDWYSFERSAQSLGRLEVPGEFKRMPVFPAFIALATPLMPRADPELHAALVLNIAFSLGSLALLFRLASPLGPGAILAPVFFAATVQFHTMGLQPLVEPSLGFFVLLCFVLFQARSRWQYAAAFAAALGRLEAATLIPILFVLNGREEGAFWKHLALAAAASSGVVGWTLAGALRGTGASFYLELMESMGWRPAPGFLLRVLREGFPFLDVGEPLVLLPLLAVAGVPAAIGIRVGLRGFRRETLAMLGYLAASGLVIVGFGVNKARYVYPMVWILPLFCAAGLLRLRELAFGWLALRLPEGASRWVAGTGLAALCASAALGIATMGTRPELHALSLDAAFALGCVGIAALPLLRGLRPPRPLDLGLACGVLAFATGLVTAGIAGKRAELFDVHYTNYANVVLADWVEHNMGPRERAIVLGKKHLLHLTGLSKHRFLSFSKVEAQTEEELAAFMRKEGYTYVVWTHRADVHDRASAYYYETLNVELAERFRSGSPVPGFAHVATLRMPEHVDSSDVQIYRLAP